MFEINVKNMTPGIDTVTVNPGGGTNNSVVIEGGSHNITTSSFGWITWVGAGTRLPPTSTTGAATP